MPFPGSERSPHAPDGRPARPSGLLRPPLRWATPADASAILGLIRGLAAYQRHPDAAEVDADTLRRQLDSDRPPFECVLAEHDGAPRGMALFFQSYSTWRGRPGLFLEDLFVEPEWRGRGLGLALLRALARIAAQRDYPRVEWAVMDWNEPTIRFYRALGAVPKDGERGYRLDGDALAKLARNGDRA